MHRRVLNAPTGLVIMKTPLSAFKNHWMLDTVLETSMWPLTLKSDWFLRASYHHLKVKTYLALRLYCFLLTIMLVHEQKCMRETYKKCIMLNNRVHFTQLHLEFSRSYRERDQQSEHAIVGAKQKKNNKGKNTKFRKDRNYYISQLVCLSSTTAFNREVGHVWMMLIASRHLYRHDTAFSHETSETP